MPSMRSLCAVMVLLPCAAAAQTVVSGVVRDSLSGRPFAGATVQLVPSTTPWEAGRTVTTDSTGHYAIADVAPGRYTFGFLHPRLDSLGMDAVSRTIDVRAKSAVRMDLALPSAATLAASLCGSRKDSTGVVVGRVFDARDDAVPARAAVRVRWSEFAFDSAGMHRVEGHVSADVGRDGRYVVCGVPTDVPVLLSAVAGDSLAHEQSGEIEVALSRELPLTHRDLLVAPADNAGATRAVHARSARLSGRVVAPDGRALANARVAIQAADAETVSDSAGNFTLPNLPAGTQQVSIVALGFAPTAVAVDLHPDRTTAIAATMKARIATLESVRVFAAAPDDRVGFYARRARGLGYFLDRDMIRKISAPDADNPIGTALATAPMLRRGGVFGRGGCRPVIYVEGMRNEIGALKEQLSPLDIGAIEVYDSATSAPPQYGSPGSTLLDPQQALPGNGGCAVILLWTTAYVPVLNTTRTSAKQ